MNRTHRRWFLLVASVSTVFAAAAILWTMGRTPWGAASGPGLWIGDIDSTLNSQLLADPYSLTHLNHGLVFFLLLWVTIGDRLAVGSRFVLALVIESAWEVLENTPFVIERFREATLAQGYYGDSILNSMGDILACAVGYWIAAKLPNEWVVALFVGLEVALVFWIRDSMILTLVMLLVPLPGVREWQLG